MNDYFDDEYYYDYDNINPDVYECIEDDWEQDYYDYEIWMEDHEIWMEAKAKFEKYLKDLMESDLYD